MYLVKLFNNFQNSIFIETATNIKLSVVPANPMDLGYANEACIANANCLGRKLALWEAGAVSNFGGPPAGAPKTQHKSPQIKLVRASNKFRFRICLKKSCLKILTFNLILIKPFSELLFDNADISSKPQKILKYMPCKTWKLNFMSRELTGIRLRPEMFLDIF